jgi:hypothetical protein
MFRHSGAAFVSSFQTTFAACAMFGPPSCPLLSSVCVTTGLGSRTKEFGPDCWQGQVSPPQRADRLLGPLRTGNPFPSEVKWPKREAVVLSCTPSQLLASRGGAGIGLFCYSRGWTMAAISVRVSVANDKRQPLHKKATNSRPCAWRVCCMDREIGGNSLELICSLII